MAKCNELKGVTLDELFGYFLLIEQYKDSLYVDGNYMPDESVDEWYKVVPMIIKDLNFREVTVIDGHVYSTSDLWEMLRQLWKEMDHAEMYELTKTIHKYWGAFQSGSK